MCHVLTEDSLHTAVQELSKRDTHLRNIVDQNGPSPLWGREPGFPTLVKTILEQKVSLSSAQAAFDKLTNALGEVSSEAFLGLADDELKQLGFSREKTRYCRILAEALLSGELDLNELVLKSNEDVFEALIGLKGIGPWTARIFSMTGPRPANFVYTAGIAAIRRDFGYVEERRKIYEQRRNYFCKAIDELGFQCHLVEGAFYALFGARSTGLSSDEFVNKLKAEENCLLSPSNWFEVGYDGFIRVPLVRPVPVLEDVVERVEHFVKGL